MGGEKPLERATDLYTGHLDLALEYLKGRGISGEVARAARLGVALSPVVGHENLRGRLTIPYCTPAGVRQIKGRALDNREPKYTGLTGVDPYLYNVRAFHRPEDYIAICEGELDALVMHEVVGIPAVAVPGVKSWKPHMYRCFAGYTKVFVVTDNDVGKEKNYGQELADRIVHDLRDQAVLIPPPNGDVTDWLLSEGADAIRKAAGV